MSEIKYDLPILIMVVECVAKELETNVTIHEWQKIDQALFDYAKLINLVRGDCDYCKHRVDDWCKVSNKNCSGELFELKEL